MTTTPKKPVTVLYLMGLWRSGSTLLDIVLGDHEMVEAVGELRYLPLGWLEGATCACGNEVSKCPFWCAVRTRWNGLTGDDAARSLLRLEDRFERGRSFPRLIASAYTRRTSSFREYGRLLQALYVAIADVSGKSIVVDSTKYPGRAFAISMIPGLDVRLVHLVRDGRAVIWSCRRKPNTDHHGNVIEIAPDQLAANTTNSWIQINILCSVVSLLARAPAMHLRYEDLMTDPERELARIGKLIGLDFDSVSNRLIRGDPIRVGHTVAGNRMRHAGAVRLRPDTEWLDKLSAADRQIFWRRAGWLAKRYRYAE